MGVTAKAEKELLNSLAKEINVTKSNYLRHLINSRERPVIRKEKEEAKIREEGIINSLISNYYGLGKVGVSINQIAHYFNLEHLKAFDDFELIEERLLLIDKLSLDEINFIKSNLGELFKKIEDTRLVIENLSKHLTKSLRFSQEKLPNLVKEGIDD